MNTTHHPRPITRETVGPAAALALVAVLALPAPAQAIPNILTYQGRLTQGSTGNPFKNTSFNMKFTFYDAKTSGTKLCDWVAYTVQVDANGNFRADIGDPNAGSGTCNSAGSMLQDLIHEKADLYMEIALYHQSAWQVLTPRVSLGATARAQHAHYADNGAPIGSVMPFAGSTPPKGWLLCDGTAVDRTQYGPLFKVIGTSHGSGNGVSTFHLPDYRGMFIRGADTTGKVDPDASSRTAMATGGNTGVKVGSVQAYATAAPQKSFAVSSAGSHGHSASTSGGGNHAHHVYNGGWLVRWGDGGGSTADRIDSAGGSGGNPITTNTTGNHSHSVTIKAAGSHAHAVSGGDNETRPKNAYVNFIIKY